MYVMIQNRWMVIKMRWDALSLSYTAEQLEAALRAAGFAEVRIEHHPEKPWIAVLAKKRE